MHEAASTAPRGLARLADWLAGWRFPAIAATFSLSFATLTLVVVLTPASPDGFGAFAEAFRVWCFDWEEGGRAPILPVAMMVSELILLALVVIWLWATPLRRALSEERRALGRTLALTLGAVTFAAGTLVSLGTPEARPFSIEALRTAVPAPALSLIDHAGEAIDLGDLRGQVVIVTAVYSTCGETCPMLLGKARRAIAGLTPVQRADLRVLALTLDPTHDTPETLGTVAFHQGAERPLWRLVSGPPAEVEATLDRWNIARTRDPETGRIDHANVYMLIDRRGLLSFRLGLGGVEDTTLLDALRLLLDEAAPNLDEP